MNIVNKDQAVTKLQNNELVCCMTDTVYGIQGLCNDIVFNKIIKLKKKKIEDGLIVIANHMHQVAHMIKWSHITNKDLERMMSYHCIATTYLLPAQPNISFSSEEEVAIRLIQDSGLLITQIIQDLGQPLLSTSCNTRGKDTAATLSEAVEYFDSKVYYVRSDSASSNTRPSLIVNLLRANKVR